MSRLQKIAAVCKRLLPVEIRWLQTRLHSRYFAGFEIYGMATCTWLEYALSSPLEFTAVVT